MKLSLKFRDDTDQSPLLRAKIPVTVLGLPFLSAVAAGDSSDLSFSLRTNFSSGPSLSVSYRPIPSPNPNPSSGVNPFSVSLKSGVGLFGSPQNSPLVFTAHFHLSNSNAALAPRFSLLVKPQFGNFSLRKTSNSASSATASSNQADSSGLNVNLLNEPITPESNSRSAFSLDRPLQWKDLRKGEGYAEINGMLSGILMTAKTSLPVMKSSVINFRWGVNFPAEGAKMPNTRPVLVLNKIELERVEEVKKVQEKKKKKIPESTKPDDLQLLKGMCSVMGREMEDLQRQNREIRQTLEGTKMQLPGLRVRGEDRKGGSPVPCERPTDFTRWRSKKAGGADEDDGQKDQNKAGSRMSELESELQKALKANVSAS